MNNLKFIYTILFAIVLLGCTSTTGNVDKNRIAIAKVNDMYLYQDELKDIVPNGTSAKDSIVLLKKYVDNWIRAILVVQKAENNLSDEQKNVEKQLQDYRNSLITYTYRKELVKQKLDTIVTNEEVEQYYNSHQGDFELKDNIIKVIYVKVNKKAPGIAKLKAWYMSDNPKDRASLSDYCNQFADNFYLDVNSWLLFDDLLKEIPIQTYNKELFLQNNRFVEVTDSSYNYFLNIKGFKIKNSLSPLAFEKENIKNIILNKRKLQLITDMEQNVYNDALNNNKIEIYIQNDKNK